MTSRYMLDTNILSDLIRNPAGKAARRLREVGETFVCTSIIVAAYGGLRAELEVAGQPIGQNDLLITAHACAIDAILVTANVDEFSRVRGLAVENWLA